MSNLARGGAMNRDAGAIAAARVRVAAAALLIGGLMAGCSSVSDANKPDAMYGGAPSQASAADAVFPDLRSVPQERPAATTPAEREAIADGLAQDRSEAAEADRMLRAPGSSSVLVTPPPLPALSDLPELQQQSRYDAAPVIPAPESRGGHRDFSKVLPERLMQTAAANTGTAETVTEDGAAAASRSAEPAVDTGPEITPAPTKKVDVKPVIGQP